MITGHFKGFILFSLIIIIHECGHILMGVLFKWKIEKIILLPFGALTIFNEDLNRRMFEEFLIVIMGPVFQIIFSFFLYLWKVDDAMIYSMSILKFNLLPIFPLDGSKILNLVLNEFTSFKRSHAFVIIISILLMVFLVISSDFNLILFLILSFLFFKVCEEIKNHKSLFNRFLLERFLKDYHFNKIKKINSLNMDGMKRDYNHLFYDGTRYISERENLRKRFDFKEKV